MSPARSFTDPCSDRDQGRVLFLSYLEERSYTAPNVQKEARDARPRMLVLLEEGKDLISERVWDQHPLAGDNADRKPGEAVYWRDVRREEAARKGSFTAESVLKKAVLRRKN